MSHPGWGQVLTPPPTWAGVNNRASHLYNPSVDGAPGSRWLLVKFTHPVLTESKGESWVLGALQTGSVPTTLT